MGIDLYTSTDVGLIRWGTHLGVSGLWGVSAY